MATAPLKLASIGECMIELTARDAQTLDLRFGGDTLNTAVYAARRLALSPRPARVDYVTALGDDPYSDQMLAGWQAEGVGTDMVARLPGRLPGLYMIRTDAEGERTFHYWRSAAAARDLFRAPEIDAATEALAGYDLVYLSGITLSIYDPESRARLFALLDRVRERGGLVAFDSNYRPRGWPDKAAARAAIDEAWRRSDIGLPTHDDERMLHGDADAQATVARLCALGVREVVVKRDKAPCLVAGEGDIAEVPPETVEQPVDTTAAGDSFNAAFLVARLLGQSLIEAARSGHRVAAAVIQHPGAIVPREAMPAD
ncbi:MAG: sugar kinase [Alphaproteobacteria bacterium]